jgi:hypothetical protein
LCHNIGFIVIDTAKIQLINVTTKYNMIFLLKKTSRRVESTSHLYSVALYTTKIQQKK